MNQVHLYDLDAKSDNLLVPRSDKFTVPDHYLSQVLYLNDVDKLLAVSALRPESNEYPFH